MSARPRRALPRNSSPRPSPNSWRGSTARATPWSGRFARRSSRSQSHDCLEGATVPAGPAAGGRGEPRALGPVLRRARRRRAARGYAPTGSARRLRPPPRCPESPRDAAARLCDRGTGGRACHRARRGGRDRRCPCGPLPRRPGPGSRQPRTGGTMTEEPNFEDSLAALEATVDALSRGDLPLDRALAVFEEGLGLYRRCHANLADSEQRVTKLIAAAEGLIEEPFPVE